MPAFSKRPLFPKTIVESFLLSVGDLQPDSVSHSIDFSETVLCLGIKKEKKREKSEELKWMSLGFREIISEKANACFRRPHKIPRAFLSSCTYLEQKGAYNVRLANEECQQKNKVAFAYAEDL